MAGTWHAESLGRDGLPELERGLSAAGQLLEAEGVTIRVAADGSPALARRAGLRVPPAIDVVAVARLRADRTLVLSGPDPLPVPLRRAVTRAARDARLPLDWLRPTERDWRLALPTGVVDRLQWRQYGRLHVGLLDRPDIVTLKLHAISRGKPATHPQREALIALRPSPEELEAAAAAMPEPRIDQAILETLLAQLPPVPSRAARGHPRRANRRPSRAASSDQCASAPGLLGPEPLALTILEGPRAPWGPVQGRLERRQLIG